MLARIRLDTTQSILVEVYKSLETNEALAKSHKLNDFLGFGLRKDDLRLQPFIDRWENPDNQSHDRLVGWINVHVRPYVNHAKSLSIRALQNAVLDDLIAGTKGMLTKLERPNGRGSGSVTLQHIQAAVVLTSAQLIARFPKELEPNRGVYIVHWHNCALRLSLKLESQISFDVERELVDVTESLPIS
jgi:hypothetical protein